MVVVVGGTAGNARPSARCSNMVVLPSFRSHACYEMAPCTHTATCTPTFHPAARGKARRSTPSLMRSARVQARNPYVGGGMSAAV